LALLENTVVLSFFYKDKFLLMDLLFILANTIFVTGIFLFFSLNILWLLKQVNKNIKITCLFLRSLKDKQIINVINPL